jgi:hypothetical protein
MSVVPSTKLERFEMWAEMIRSDQMTHEQVHQFLAKNSDFAAWYLSEKLGDEYVSAID